MSDEHSGSGSNEETNYKGSVNEKGIFFFLFILFFFLVFSHESLSGEAHGRGTLTYVTSKNRFEGNFLNGEM